MNVILWTNRIKDDESIQEVISVIGPFATEQFARDYVAYMDLENADEHVAIDYALIHPPMMKMNVVV